MPDAARAWVEKMQHYFDDDEAPWCHIVRLLAENERLKTERDNAEKKMMDCLDANSKLGDAYRVLQADRDALVAYVRAKEDYIPAQDAVIPLKIVEAWQELGDELRNEILRRGGRGT